jgi:hypothetical protein
MQRVGSVSSCTLATTPRNVLRACGTKCGSFCTRQNTLTICANLCIDANLSVSSRTPSFPRTYGFQVVQDVSRQNGGCVMCVRFTLVGKQWGLISSSLLQPNLLRKEKNNQIYKPLYRFLQTSYSKKTTLLAAVTGGGRGNRTKALDF